MSARALAAALVAVAFATGCQRDEIEVERTDEEVAQLFNERCSACHTLAAAASRGSSSPGVLSDVERTNGPSFDARHVNADDALFAIRNGGFSGAIMPANIVVGDDAEAIAEFIEKYSGPREEGDFDADDPPAGQ